MKMAQLQSYSHFLAVRAGSISRLKEFGNNLLLRYVVSLKSQNSSGVSMTER